MTNPSKHPPSRSSTGEQQSTDDRLDDPVSAARLELFHHSKWALRALRRYLVLVLRRRA